VHNTLREGICRQEPHASLMRLHADLPWH
jgi:hypothetical protein